MKKSNGGETFVVLVDKVNTALTVTICYTDRHRTKQRLLSVCVCLCRWSSAELSVVYFLVQRLHEERAAGQGSRDPGPGPELGRQPIRSHGRRLSCLATTQTLTHALFPLVNSLGLLFLLDNTNSGGKSNIKCFTLVKVS